MKHLICPDIRKSQKQHFPAFTSKPGKATITATYKKKNYKCVVTVKGKKTESDTPEPAAPSPEPTAPPSEQTTQETTSPQQEPSAGQGDESEKKNEVIELPELEF